MTTTILLRKPQKTPSKYSKSPAKSAVETCGGGPCAPDSVTLSCGHEERSYILDLMEDSPPSTEKVLAVIARSDEPDIMSLLSVGTCNNGKVDPGPDIKNSKLLVRPNKTKCCPSIRVTGGSTFVEQGGDMRVSVAPTMQMDERLRLFEFIVFCVNPEKYVTRYQVQAITCEGVQPYRATVKVYPRTEWSGDVKFGYQFKPVKKSESSNKKSDPIDTGFYCQGGIDAKFDTRQWKYSWEPIKPSEGKNNDIASAATFEGVLALKSFMSECLDFLKQIKDDDMDINITWPQIGISGNAELAEKAQSPNIGLEGKLKVGFDPLIGVEFKTDILNALLGKIPGVGSVLVKIKKAASEGISLGPVSGKGTLAVELSTGGSIKGNLVWEFKGDSSIIPDGTVGGKISFKAAGVIEGEAEIFNITIGGGKAYEIKATKGGEDPIEISGEWKASIHTGELQVDGEYEFSGIAVYRVQYKKIGKKAIDDETRVGNFRFKPSPSKNVQEIDEEKIFEIAKKRSWPDKTQRVKLPNGTETASSRLIDFFRQSRQ